MTFSQGERDMDQSGDLHTFQVLTELANGIDPDIQMESDVPSAHGNGRLPVLDLNLFVESNQVKFSFYSKPCSSPYTVMYQSALPAKQKRETILQEGLRRLRNCSPDLEETEVIEILTTFMNSLRISGYNHSYRYQMLKGILERRRQINAKILEGEWKRYRSKYYVLKEKSIHYKKVT